MSDVSSDQGLGLVSRLLLFGRLLKTLGLKVHVGRLLDVAAALQHVDLGRRDDVYHACRALLVHGREDLAVFDQAFEAFWRNDRGGITRPPDGLRDTRDATRSRGQPAAPGARPVTPRPTGQSDTVDDESVGAFRTWSDAEVLAHKDFGTFTDRETAMARAALNRLNWSPGERRTRRWVPGHGMKVDLRRALARSVRTGGDIVTWPMRHRRTQPRPLVLLCDISGSMERYSRMLLHFTHALATTNRRVEAFVFSTRLTHITRELRTRNIDQALASVSRAVPDWSGGTRIGEALRQFHRRWSRRLPRGPVVLLISDGWDRGDPALLGEQVRWLQRRSTRLIWLNPLVGTADYAPSTRSLQAALPFVDDFLPARSLADLSDLAVHLNALPAR